MSTVSLNGPHYNDTELSIYINTHMHILDTYTYILCIILSQWYYVNSKLPKKIRPENILIMTKVQTVTGYCIIIRSSCINSSLFSHICFKPIMHNHLLSHLYSSWNHYCNHNHWCAVTVMLFCYKFIRYSCFAFREVHLKLRLFLHSTCVCAQICRR